MNSKLLGYKSAIVKENSKDIRVIITLIIPFNARTTCERVNIINPLYAKYRTNFAKILCIEDEFGNKYNEAYTAFYKKKILYKVNVLINCAFDNDINIVCGKGIHFFLNKNVAYNYGRKILEQKWDVPNLYQTFYDNGQIKERCDYIFDKDYGFIKKTVDLWFDNGKKWRMESYQHDLKHGLFCEWFGDGILKQECNFINGNKNGLEKFYYFNGQNKMHINYKNGIVNGICNLWHLNGKLYVECEFDRGITLNNFKKWNKFGKLIENNKNYENEVNELNKLIVYYALYD